MGTSLSVLFRADAHEELGGGHVMRCLSLAHAMRKREWSVAFAEARVSEGFQNRIREAGYELTMVSPETDAEDTLSLARKIGAQWVVLDGYMFNAAYQRKLKTADLQLLTIDDMGALDFYEADVILNQNIASPRSLYATKAPKSRLLLGVRFVLLGPQFLEKKRAEKPPKESVERVMITFGAGDPKNLTLKALRALEKLPGEFAIDAVVGGMNPYRAEIEAFVAHTKHPCSVIVDTKDMPSLMEKADMAVATAGTTTWELMYMGVPFVTGAFSKNQRGNADELGKRNLAGNAGWYPDISEDDLSQVIEELMRNAATRKEQSRRGQALIDGKGADRVCDAMLATGIVLRKAKPEDLELLFTWANDPAVRSSSFSPEPIEREDHERWFIDKLKDPSCTIFVAEHDGVPIGQIRFDIKDNDAVVDLHVAPGHRGKNYSSAIISEGIRTLFAENPVPAAHAFVKTDNEASRKAFLDAGFTEEGTTKLHEFEVYHLHFKR